MGSAFPDSARNRIQAYIDSGRIPYEMLDNNSRQMFAPPPTQEQKQATQQAAYKAAQQAQETAHMQNFDPEMSDLSLQYRAANPIMVENYTPPPNNLNTDFMAKHPTFAKIFTPLGKAGDAVMSVPFIQRAGQTGAEVMTTVDNPDKATTGSRFGDTAADLTGAVMGFAYNPKGAASVGLGGSAGARLWGGSEQLAGKGLSLIPQVAKLPAFAQTGLKLGATTIPYEATMAAANNRPVDAGEMGTAVASNALLGMLPYGIGKAAAMRKGNVGLPETLFRPSITDVPPVEFLKDSELLRSANKTPPAYVNPEVYQGIQSMQRPAYVNPQVWESLNRPVGAGNAGQPLMQGMPKAELPGMPTIAPKVSAEVMPTGGIPRPATKTGPAIWHNNGVDTPVTVTGEAGRDKLGRQYVRVEESNTAVPLDEIRQSADKGLLGEGSISAAKFTIPEKMADVGDGTKVRSLGVSVMENPATPSDVKAGLLMESMEGGANTFTPITNKATLDEAGRMVDADINAAIRHAKENPGTALSNTIKLKLMERANTEGRWDDAVDIATEAAGGGTTQGQAVQSLILWSRLKPEGMQRFYAKTIEGVNKDIAKRGNQLKKLKLDPKIMEDIKIKMDDIGKLPEGRDKVIKTAQVLDTIVAQVPVPFLRKVASIQTMAQLLNPKTAGRNIFGNFGFAAIENVSDVVGAGVDKGLSLLTGNRTKVLPGIMAQLRGGKQGWKHGLEEALLGIDTTGLATKQDLPMGKVFRGKIGGKLETALAVELRATDRSFYQAAYDGSLNNQMRAAKVSVPTDEMKNIAHLDGLYRTFQDDNALSKGFQGIKRILNGQQEFGVGDFVIKYPRTPANLLMRGIEYSPAGFIKTIIKAAEPLAKREFNQKAFVESFSRALVGSTTLVGTGALLNKLGIVSGAPVADKDLAELQREQGFGEYRINVSALKRLVFGGDTKKQLGDKIVDYSWFQPMAICIAIGADINANKGNATGIVGTILQSFATGINALADQPVTQGIQTLLGGGYGDSTQGLTQVLTGIPSSFVPTLLNQIKQLADNQRRETYDPNKKQKALNLAINKIPGLAGKLPAKYSTLGQPLETYQDKSNNPFNVFINPAFVNTYNPSPEMQKVNDIYEQTGAVNQVPRVAPKSITVSGQTFPLTGEEFATYQRLVGEYTQQGFAKVSVGTKPEEAAKKMQDIMTDANTKAKTQILQARGIRVIKSGGGIAIK